MMQPLHGGDIYSNKIKYDYSINVNPLGIPWRVRLAALKGLLDGCDTYPDLNNCLLKELLADSLNQEISPSAARLTRDNVILGNGASQLITAICHFLCSENLSHCNKPQNETIKLKDKIIIPTPTYSEYELSATAAGFSIVNYSCDSSLKIKADILKLIDDSVAALFLCNPNNPTGMLTDQNLMYDILGACALTGVYLVVDECYLSLSDYSPSLIKYLSSHPNLIILSAFTKTFAMPGLRVGYAVSSDMNVLSKIAKQLPPWSLSAPAVSGAISALKLKDSYIKKTQAYIAREKKYLFDSFNKKPINKIFKKVYETNSTFFLVESDHDLYQILLSKKMLIRDCSNIKGLRHGFYRIAVKSHVENVALIKALCSIAKTGA